MENGVKFVTFSFQGYKDKPIPEILNYLADDIASTINGLPKEVREKAYGTHNFFELFLPIIIDKYLSGKKLVLLLDEFDVLEEDKITKNNQGKKIFNQLKNAVKQQEKLFAILVFGRPLKDMDYLEAFLQKEGQKPIEVGLLNYESTKKLIVQPAKGILEYKQSAIDRIWKLSAGHPSLTQLLCSKVFVHCRDKKKKLVQEDDVDSILSKAMEEGEVVLRGFLDTLNKNEKYFFIAVAEAQEIGTDPLNILKIEKLTVETEYLRSAEKRLVELCFLETKGKGSKIKVELVRLWLLKNYPLLSQEDRKKRKNYMTQPKPNRPNLIAQLFAFIVVISIVVSFGLSLTDGVLSSGNFRRAERECFKLSEEISKALDDKKDTKNQLQVIEQVRTEWSREKENLLDKKCPYPSELDAKYNELLQYYGQSQVDTGNFDEGIEAFCEITSEYKNFSDIKQIFDKWVLINKRLSNESIKRVLNKIIEQNQSGNDCLAYSFKDDRNKNELYDHKAQVHASDYEYDQAVESYCKITNNYYNFKTVVKQLEKWLSNESDQPYWRSQDAKKVEDKLKELKNQCPAFPPSLDN